MKNAFSIWSHWTYCIPPSRTLNVVPGSSVWLAKTGCHGNQRYMLCDICFNFNGMHIPCSIK